MEVNVLSETAQRAWLIKLRGNRTQQEIADMAGIDRSFYTQIETGTRNPSVGTAKDIATTLGFNWTLFFENVSSDMQQNKNSEASQSLGS